MAIIINLINAHSMSVGSYNNSVWEIREKSTQLTESKFKKKMYLKMKVCEYLLFNWPKMTFFLFSNISGVNIWPLFWTISVKMIKSDLFFFSTFSLHHSKEGFWDRTFFDAEYSLQRFDGSRVFSNTLSLKERFHRPNIWECLSCGV